MILLFRFYTLLNGDINNSIFKLNSPRRARYTNSKLDKFKNLKIYEHYLNRELVEDTKETMISSNGKCIEIDDKKYYRSPNDYFSHDIYYLRNSLNIEELKCQFVFTVPNDNKISQKYNNYNDIYIVFKSFEEFYLWYKKYKAFLSFKIYRQNKINLKDQKYINKILSIIENHFNSKEGNIMLFKMVFKPDNFKRKL